VLLTIFCSTHPVSRIAATLFSTPIPFAVGLAGKPYSIAASAATLVFFLIVASEAFLPPRGVAPRHAEAAGL
jgi:hypothetical protein